MEHGKLQPRRRLGQAACQQGSIPAAGLLRSSRRRLQRSAAKQLCRPLHACRDMRGPFRASFGTQRHHSCSPCPMIAGECRVWLFKATPKGLRASRVWLFKATGLMASSHSDLLGCWESASCMSSGLADQWSG